jgi:uncharacterized membrane protein YvlD (DUF360 family)
MLRFIIRILLTAVAFAFILPLLPGIDFKGNFGIAIVAALLFGIVAWCVDVCAILLATFFAISTLGLGLLILIPLWLLGFLILPAVTLHLMPDVMPGHLVVNGWIPAIEGGLILFVIGVATNPGTKKKKD